CTMQEPLPVDAALPALANAHYEALAAALARVGLQGARAVSVLRHNPGKRCTLAVASDTDRYIVKLFADAATVLAVSTVHNVFDDVQRYVRTIGSAAGELGARAGAMRDQLAANMPPPGCTDLRHGGFYLSHVFDLVDGPGVIDWDTFRQGPVEVDAGMLCAAARWEMYQPEYERATRRAIAVFLDEVDDLVDPARLRWYRTAALLKFASHRARRGAGDLAA